MHAPAQAVRMVLRLDSRFTAVWRDPFSLQFGVDPARVILREVTSAQERMIAALSSGVSRSGLDMIATSAGAEVSDVASLLRRLKPVLQEPVLRENVLQENESLVAAPRVSIVGRGPTVDRIATSLSLAKVQVTVSTSCLDDDCDLGIAIGHYVLHPESYGFWLRRDRPHLPVLFGDDSVTMGPLVDAGRTPCLYCLEYYRRDADASWSAIASQLWGRRAASETPLVSVEVAARVSRMVLARLADGHPRGRSMSARSFRLDAQTGEVTRRDWMPHPDCGCVAIPSDVSAGRPETGSPPDLGQPRTVAVSVARA